LDKPHRFSVRDNFTRQVIAEIAKGVGYLCSNPDCRRPTIAANAAQDGIVTLGVAAHICAASPGGPRHDPGQTQQERSSKANGLWLCQNCGRIIDADPRSFPVKLLRQWKQAAQGRALHLLLTGSADTARFDALAETGRQITDVPRDKAISARVASASRADLSNYQRQLAFGANAVALTLRLEADPAAASFTIHNLPQAIEVAPDATIVAPAGTGKTTTLLQLAEISLFAGVRIPLYVGLGEWSAGTSRLWESFERRPAFRDLKIDDLHYLAEQGRLLLLLDGWNELESGHRSRLRAEIAALQRDYPALRIIVTTRKQALDVPLSGPRLTIAPLSEDQQRDLADARGGETGKRALDRAWRTPGLRELMATPLYLQAFLSSQADDAAPATKEAVLRRFVDQHERPSEHASALYELFFGCHQDFLVALAVDLNDTNATSMPEAAARDCVARNAAKLKQVNQLIADQQPAILLDALASHHCLIRSTGASGPEGTVAFPHQQIQEWFASIFAETLIRASAAGDIIARGRLRATVLDKTAWEESVLFAVERLAHQPDDVSVAAHAIQLALGVDPMLAAEMIFRTGTAAWRAIDTEVLAFATRWHRAGTVDRAARFMIITGRPEFAPFIWPLASSSDTQTQIPALRSAPRFRPGVLGADAPTKIAALPEPIRMHLLALIAAESGVDGLDLATDLAKTDPSAEVQAEVATYLFFRRADRHAADLLAAAKDAALLRLARRDYVDMITDPVLLKRLETAEREAVRTAATPQERIRALLDGPANDPERAHQIAETIADLAFPISGDQARSLIHLIYESAPDALAEGLRRRLLAGLEIPFDGEIGLARIAPSDDPAIAALTLSPAAENRSAEMAAGLAGPITVAALIEEYVAAQLELQRRYEAAAADRSRELRERIAATQPAPFLEAVLAVPAQDQPASIGAVASLIKENAAYGAAAGRNRSLAIRSEDRPRFLALLRSWAATALATAENNRTFHHEVVGAIGQLALTELLPEVKQLLDDALNRVRAGRARWVAARQRGEPMNGTVDTGLVYRMWYRTALEQLGEQGATLAADYLEDREFGVDATVVIKAHLSAQDSAPQPSFFQQWPRFEAVAAARLAREAGRAFADTSSPGDPIFAAIDRLAQAESDEEGQCLAIRLLPLALAIPHGNQDALVARVAALPQPLATKREVFAAMAIDGQVLAADLILEAIDGWLIGAAKDDNIAWQKRQNTWEIEPWLELLPFSDRPQAVIGALDRVKDFYSAGWTKRWERVLNAVTALPGIEGDELLECLARRHGDIADPHDWMRAFIGRNTTATTLTYLDLCAEEVLRSADSWHLARGLNAQAKGHPDLKTALKSRYAAAAGGAEQVLLEAYMQEAADAEDVLILLNRYAGANRPCDGGLLATVRAASLWHEPQDDQLGSYAIHPASTGLLRKQLFSLVDDSTHIGILAAACLAAIDDLRDDYGSHEDDPRHPDVRSGRLWPQELATIAIDHDRPLTETAGDTGAVVAKNKTVY